MKRLLTTVFLSASAILLDGCSKPSSSTTEASAQNLAFPRDERVQAAVNQMLAGVRRGGWPVSVKGVRQTPDGGEADLVFQNFNYEISGQHVYNGEGVGMIARYSDGYYLTRITFNYGDYVTGKIRL